MSALAVDGYVRLGGRRQYVRARAARRGLPTLLVLHGGPGFANGRAFLTRHAELAETFTVVTWDQRGAGASALTSGVERLTLERLVADAAELVAYVRRRTPGPLYVLGLSWGSELGIRLLQAAPEGVTGYIGSGQAVDGIRGEELSWAWAAGRARERGDVWGMRALRLVGPPVKAQYGPTPVLGLAIQRRVLARGAVVTGVTAPSATGEAAVLVTPGAVPAVPPPGVTERVGAAFGVVRSLSQLWPIVTDYDFRTDATKLAVPVWFLQGRHDHTTPSELVAEYAAVLRAPSVTLRWFEGSGHSPGHTEPEEFRRALREIAEQGERA